MLWHRVTVQDGIEQVAFARTDQPARVSLEEAHAWLDAKEASHRARGWHVERHGDEVYAFRRYESGRAKGRRMFIREAK